MTLSFLALLCIHCTVVYPGGCDGQECGALLLAVIATQNTNPAEPSRRRAQNDREIKGLVYWIAIKARGAVEAL
jgi:hypothetical protein